MRAKIAAAAELIGDISRVRQPIEQAWHAPGAIYHSPELFQLEVERYFRNDWMMVGRVEELSQPGDFLTLRIADEPIVVARDKDGNLNAFYNMCVHRGVEVAYGCGNTRSFKCPYHGWVYDLSGKLTGAAYMKESPGFEIGAERMRPLRLGVWRGNVFVTFNDDAPPLETHVAEWEKDFGWLGMERCRLANKIVLEFDCNWKFVHENLMDFYHVGVLHAKSFGAKFSWDDNGIRLKDGGGLSIFYNAAPPTPGGEPLLGKMPWMEDQPYSFACTGYLPPNLTMFGRVDCVRPMVTWPLSAGRSRTIIYHLFPEEVFARPDFEEKMKIYREYQILVLEEDRIMIESMQQAMGSPSYRPGRMSTLEKPLHHFINGHLDRMFGPEDRREAAE